VRKLRNPHRETHVSIFLHKVWNKRFQKYLGHKIRKRKIHHLRHVQIQIQYILAVSGHYKYCSVRHSSQFSNKLNVTGLDEYSAVVLDWASSW